MGRFDACASRTTGGPQVIYTLADSKDAPIEPLAVSRCLDLLLGHLTMPWRLYRASACALPGRRSYPF